MEKRTHKFIAPLFCENGNLSLGRISFWIVFAMCAWLWFTLPVGQDIPPSMMQMMYITATYNLLKKGVDMWGTVKTSSTSQFGYSQNGSGQQFGGQNQMNRVPQQPINQQRPVTTVIVQPVVDDDSRSPKIP